MCGLRDCRNELPEVPTYLSVTFGEKKYDVPICEYDLWILSEAKPGSFKITPDLTLEAIPATPKTPKKGKK